MVLGVDLRPGGTPAGRRPTGRGRTLLLGLCALRRRRSAGSFDGARRPTSTRPPPSPCTRPRARCCWRPWTRVRRPASGCTGRARDARLLLDNAREVVADAAGRPPGRGDLHRLRAPARSTSACWGCCSAGAAAAAGSSTPPSSTPPCWRPGLVGARSTARPSPSRSTAWARLVPDLERTLSDGRRRGRRPGRQPRGRHPPAGGRGRGAGGPARRPALHATRRAAGPRGPARGLGGRGGVGAQVGRPGRGRGAAGPQGVPLAGAVPRRRPDRPRGSPASRTCRQPSPPRPRCRRCWPSATRSTRASARSWTGCAPDVAAVPDVDVVGDPVHRLPHVLTFSCLYVDGRGPGHRARPARFRGRVRLRLHRQHPGAVARAGRDGRPHPRQRPGVPRPGHDRGRRRPAARRSLPGVVGASGHVSGSAPGMRCAGASTSSSTAAGCSARCRSIRLANAPRRPRRSAVRSPWWPTTRRPAPTSRPGAACAASTTSARTPPPTACRASSCAGSTEAAAASCRPASTATGQGRWVRTCAATSCAASSPYDAANRATNSAWWRAYSWVPTRSTTCAASRQPELGGALQRQVPLERGEEPGPEGVPDPGRLDRDDVLGGRHHDRVLAGPLDPDPVGAQGDHLVPTRSRTSCARPAGLLLDEVLLLPMLPRHLLERPYREGQAERALVASLAAVAIAGLGPFRLKEFVPGQRIVLERNPYYWKTDAAGTRLPYLAELVFTFSGVEDLQVMRFQSGESDVISRIASKDYAVLHAGKRAARLHAAGRGLRARTQLPGIQPRRHGARPHLEPGQLPQRRFRRDRPRCHRSAGVSRQRRADRDAGRGG